MGLIISLATPVIAQTDTPPDTETIPIPDEGESVSVVNQDNSLIISEWIGIAIILLIGVAILAIVAVAWFYGKNLAVVANLLFQLYQSLEGYVRATPSKRDDAIYDSLGQLVGYAEDFQSSPEFKALPTDPQALVKYLAKKKGLDLDLLANAILNRDRQ